MVMSGDPSEKTTAAAILVVYTDASSALPYSKMAVIRPEPGARSAGSQSEQDTYSRDNEHELAEFIWFPGEGTHNQREPLTSPSPSCKALVMSLTGCLASYYLAVPGVCVCGCVGVCVCG